MRTVFMILCMIVIFTVTFSIYFSFMLKQYILCIKKVGFFNSIYKKWTLETYIDFFIPFGSELFKNSKKNKDADKDKKKTSDKKEGLSKAKIKDSDTKLKLD